MKRWTLIAMAGLALLVATVFGIGLLLPVDHQARVSFAVNAPAARVWQLITDVEDFPAWRPDVDEVELLPDVNGLASWNERGSGGTLPLVVEQEDAPHELVTRIKEGLPFGGTWTYHIEPMDSLHARVTIVEDGEVYNPIFRFVSRFIMGHDATLNRYREAVEQALRSGPDSDR
ncbi:MAG: SRPBCC family protein [Gemmatimonadetes bacterium]|nr:SRPBCC family protein [Gemmatimonadota bacterium]